VYSFGADEYTAKLLNEKKLQEVSGLNIEVEGLGAMLVALYIPNRPIAFVKDAGYYPPVESDFNEAITIPIDLDVEATEQETVLNPRYVLVSR
jgi:hypothetical protein